MVEAISSGKMLHWMEHPTRTAIAAVVSLVVATAIGLPEAYWAPITTLIATQSTLGASWTVSFRRLAGTALGAASGAVLMRLWGGNVFAFGIGILVMGMMCPALRLEKTAYRYAGITLAIAAIWPEREAGQAGAAA